MLKKRMNVQGSAPKPVKRKLVGLLKGSFLKLCKLGAASRFLEALFMWCDVSDKETVAQPLAEHLTEMKVCAPLWSTLPLLQPDWPARTSSEIRSTRVERKHK